VADSPLIIFVYVFVSTSRNAYCTEWSTHAGCPGLGKLKLDMTVCMAVSTWFSPQCH